MLDKRGNRMRRFLTGLTLLLGLALALAALPAWAQSKPDRSVLPLQEALAGHWYLKAYDKHEYFEVVTRAPSPGENRKTYGPVKMTWDTKGGKEVSQGAILNSFHTVDEKQNMLILTYKSTDGEHVYFSRYAFSPDRNTLTEQGLDEKLKPNGAAETLVYLDSKTKSPYVRGLSSAQGIQNKKAHDAYKQCELYCAAQAAVNNVAPKVTMQCQADCKAQCRRAGGAPPDCG
jgi:hypothetical protein